MENTVMVQNLTSNKVIYIDNDGGVTRRIQFAPQQKMELPRTMVDRMSYDQGGSTLLRNFLSVKDDEVRKNIGIPEDQVEYDYTEADVIKCLKENEIDVIADALDFGPLGIKELIAEQAVALPIENRTMMALITEKTGRDIEVMIKNREQFEAGQEREEAPKSKRRVQHKKSEPTSSRRKAVKTEGKAEEKGETAEKSEVSEKGEAQTQE